MSPNVAGAPGIASSGNGVSRRSPPLSLTPKVPRPPFSNFATDASNPDETRRLDSAGGGREGEARDREIVLLSLALEFLAAAMDFREGDSRRNIRYDTPRRLALSGGRRDAMSEKEARIMASSEGPCMPPRWCLSAPSGGRADEISASNGAAAARRARKNPSRARRAIRGVFAARPRRAYRPDK